MGESEEGAFCVGHWVLSLMYEKRHSYKCLVKLVHLSDQLWPIWKNQKGSCKAAKIRLSLSVFGIRNVKLLIMVIPSMSNW